MTTTQERFNTLATAARDFLIGRCGLSYDLAVGELDGLASTIGAYVKADNPEHGLFIAWDRVGRRTIAIVGDVDRIARAVAVAGGYLPTMIVEPWQDAPTVH